MFNIEVISSTSASSVSIFWHFFFTKNLGVGDGKIPTKKGKVWACKIPLLHSLVGILPSPTLRAFRAEPVKKNHPVETTKKTFLCKYPGTTNMLILCSPGC